MMKHFAVGRVVIHDQNPHAGKRAFAGRDGHAARRLFLQARGEPEG